MTLKTRLTAVGGGLVLALTLAACGDAEDTPPPQPGETMTTESTTTPAAQAEGAHNDADTQFAQMMIVHHEGAIEMADAAVEMAETDEVRALAERISAAQGPEIEQMTSWLEGWGEETAPMDHGGMDHGGMDMDGMSQEEAMEHLGAQSGSDFDRTFLELMIAHHRGAVEMAQSELDAGENAEALELAEKIIADQEAEIAEMEGLLEGQ
ncbi:DUF305 domain-containing protein [Georgenia sp. H159]|uniref:DUF305 domain-containing protein n=1 Tax=Georgenia sp. H159 TaxID=3076115 RepID=UPI002D77BB53|nr:DUF305 domain-containing protein [Georgenia sp. H159]